MYEKLRNYWEHTYSWKYIQIDPYHPDSFPRRTLWMCVLLDWIIALLRIIWVEVLTLNVAQVVVKNLNDRALLSDVCTLFWAKIFYFQKLSHSIHKLRKNEKRFPTYSRRNEFVVIDIDIDFVKCIFFVLVHNIQSIVQYFIFSTGRFPE